MNFKAKKCNIDSVGGSRNKKSFLTFLLTPIRIPAKKVKSFFVIISLQFFCDFKSTAISGVISFNSHTPVVHNLGYAINRKGYVRFSSVCKIIYVNTFFLRVRGKKSWEPLVYPMASNK